MAPTPSAFAKLDGAGLGEDDPMALPGQRVNERNRDISPIIPPC